ncbi:hypothetical protein ACFQ3Z_16075 [Streptomyces nogalater]
MTISTVGSLQQNRGNGVGNLPVSGAVIGNAWVLVVRIADADIGTASVTGGGPDTWTRIASASQATVNGTIEIWLGVIASTASTTITVTYNSDIAGVSTELVAVQFTSSLTNTVWTGDSSDTTTSGTATATITYPALTPTGAECYMGYVYLTNTAALAPPKDSRTPPRPGNGVVWNPP